MMVEATKTLVEETGTIVGTGKQKSPPAIRWRAFFPVLAAPAAYGLQHLAGQFPDTVESWYARGFYPVVVGAWSRVTGLFPFSVMEVLMGLLAVACPILVVLHVLRILRAEKGARFRTLVRPIPTLLVILAIWYALTVLLWNLNYARPSFSVLSGLATEPANTDVLKSVCGLLAAEANAAREEVSEDRDGIMKLRDGVHAAAVKASSGYDILSARFPFLSGSYGPPKPVMLSELMSWTRIIGIYTVTTAEANVDIDIPQAEIPFTMMHEMAHQRGIAREDEANASAWFACRMHPDPDFRYSGALQTWIYASNALRTADATAWQEVAATLSPAVKLDLAAQYAYWARYDTVVDKVADKANDLWLKTNGQRDGVKSYGRMVDIIIAEYRSSGHLAMIP